jgi:signal transduction histidine kinase
MARVRSEQQKQRRRAMRLAARARADDPPDLNRWTPTPADLDEIVEADARALAALARHRAIRLANEPPPRGGRT